MGPARLSTAVNAARLARQDAMSSQSEREPELPELLCAMERNNTGFLLASRSGCTRWSVALGLGEQALSVPSRPVWDDEPRLQIVRMREAPSLDLCAELAPALRRKDTQMRAACRGEAPGDRCVDAGDSRLLPASRESAGSGKSMAGRCLEAAGGILVTDTQGGVCVSQSHSCLCVNAELPAPRPSISISPSGVITLGGAVTIRCQCRCEARRLFLYKGGIQIRELDADGDGGEFTIPSARREHGGVYTCQSRSRSEPPDWSDPSDIMQIIVVETTYSKPSISLRPSGGVALGGAVTVRCQGWYQNVRFLLYKDGNPNALQDAEPAGNVAEFPISNVSRRDAGSYSCYYHHKLYPFIWSYPSDPVELVVPNYTKPTISMKPSKEVSLGRSMSVWCQGQCQGVRFVLNKERRHFTPVESDRFGAVFTISNVSREDGGSYSCSCHSKSEPFTVSYPSDPDELLVRDPSLPRPSISLSPTGVTAPGADVTIRCQGQRRNVTFFLHKPRDLNPQRHVDPAGDWAEFRLPTVGRQHRGNYSCSYRPQSEPFVSSEPSDPVELVVAEPTLPKPIISPSGEVSLGGAVSIQCRGQGQGVRIVLNKGGRHVAHVDSEKSVFEFPINNVRREQSGNYSCSHHSRSEPFVRWSESVELVVRG
ncbi:immunoglobulin superfamily member 1-like [Trachemys scripta elegans]|uniref:immunoglobulin superfamily member 1-like n=1 Tax=Trachemys scripta elegans TaxID=31138 RepID=UPI00155811C7|nr:immunoglobulin superfamily member 1-like [Trachemys scripta elegans]